MTLWLQHVLVLLIVAACVAVVLGQGVRTLRGKKSKLGACCAKGCDLAAPHKAEATSSGKRIVFLPVELLSVSGRGEKGRGKRRG